MILLAVTDWAVTGFALAGSRQRLTHIRDGTDRAAALLVTSALLGPGQILAGAALLVLPEKNEITERVPA